MSETLRNLHTPAGTAGTDKTVATLTMLRMQRESDLAKVFDVLGLERGKDTADDAVAIIKELINAYSRMEISQK